MQINEIKEHKEVLFDDIFKYGQWIIGDFQPSLIQTKEFEIGVFRIPEGHTSDGHWHKYAVESNLIISGECIVVSNGIKHKLKAGNVFTFPPNVPTHVKYTKETLLLVVKIPSVPGDKHYKVKEDDEG